MASGPGRNTKSSCRTATLSVAGRVENAIRQEAAISPLSGRPDRRAGSGWKALAGLGVAASVALLAVLGVNTLRESTAPPLPAVASGDAETVVAPVARVDDEKWNRIQPEIDERLSGYLVNHNEYAASRGVQGVMPYVRIVGFDNDR